MAEHDELVRLSAREVRRRLLRDELTPLDLLDALERRIGTVEPLVHALPTLCLERARDAARRLGELPAAERGLLAGLPVAIKDLTEVAGVRTTFGSTLYADHVPQRSDLLVEQLERHDGIVYAKSNTPEFGAGGNTFNELFPATCNPHDIRLSAGGSSGGAAAALASGTAWLAQGSDLAGSLRTPASFCGVTSWRPSPGRIVASPGSLPFDTLATDGPMARDVGDLALFGDAMTGRHPGTGLCSETPPGALQAAVDAPRRPRRIAYSDDLGITATDPVVAATCRAAVERLQREGVAIDEAHPPLDGAHAAFDALRAAGYAIAHAEDLERQPRALKPEVDWNIRQGLALDGGTLRDAMAAQGRLFVEASRFMQGFDLLLCPAASVLPFPVGERYPGHADGVPYADYYRWLAIAYAVTLTTLPVVTIPCGRTPDGLPVGLQLIGRPHDDVELFRLARWIEQALAQPSAPVLPRSPADRGVSRAVAAG